MDCRCPTHKLDAGTLTLFSPVCDLHGGKLTPAQRRVVRALDALTKRNGVLPTIRELTTELGFRGTHAVECFFEALERKGAVRRAAKLSRTARVICASDLRD